MKSKKAKIIVPIVIVLVLAAVVVGLMALRAPNKRIYEEYAAQMETVTAEYLDKLSQAENSGIVNLAFIEAEGTNKLAFLGYEGVAKMAKRSFIAEIISGFFPGSFDISGYEKWGGKLDEKYEEEATKLGNKYTEIIERKYNI